jgi:hypothetical protein
MMTVTMGITTDTIMNRSRPTIPWRAPSCAYANWSARAALALAEALRQGKTGECVVLRRDLTNNLRSLNVALDQQLKRDTVRGKLVPTEVAISMIDAGVREALMVIRRLPDSARDQQEKEKAEAFVFAVTDAMKHGANAARAIARSRGYACPPS